MTTPRPAVGSTIIGKVAGPANFAWDDDHRGHCRVPVVVEMRERTGVIQVAAACARGGDDRVEIRFGLGNHLAQLPVGTAVWARGTVSGEPFQLRAVELRRYRKDVTWGSRLRLVGAVGRAAPDGRVTLALDDGTTLRAMLPRDTAISVGERITATVLPAPRGLVPWLRNIAFDSTEPIPGESLNGEPAEGNSADSESAGQRET